MDTRMRLRTNVIRFTGKHENGEILKYQHFILNNDYTACGYATDEYDTTKKIGYITCPKCMDIINDIMEILKSNGVIDNNNINKEQSDELG